MKAKKEKTRKKIQTIARRQAESVRKTKEKNSITKNSNVQI